MLKVVVILGIMLFLPNIVCAASQTYNNETEGSTDSTYSSRSFIHRLETEVRPAYIIPTNSFLRGDNYNGTRINRSVSAHLKYAFQFRPNTYTDQIYKGAYQGIGLAYYTFGEPKHIGNPFTFYIFQGAQLIRFNPRLSLNYEWNFGISTGWYPYDYNENPDNRVIGSKTNAYLDINFYFNWKLSQLFDLNAGVDINHFSNGNTKYPNSGLNTTGLKVGLVYNFNRKENILTAPSYQSEVPKFPHHISYDLLLFGSWRRKGVTFGNQQIASPETYTVLGFNFAPMYNINYRFRTGISVDGVYDESANVYTKDYIEGTEQPFYKPPLKNQLALGLSGHIEYIMPYFTINVGIGANVLHGGGDLKALYQTLALKIEVTRSSFIHIGYNLQNFHTPNFLMLGIGYRFHNKYPHK